MPQAPVVKCLKRVTDNDGNTLHFMIPGSDRQHPPQFLPRSGVPAFEGDLAYFEMVKVHAKPWPFWKVLRQVEEPGTEN